MNAFYVNKIFNKLKIFQTVENENYFVVVGTVVGEQLGVCRLVGGQ